MGITAKGNEGAGTEVLGTDLIGGVHYPKTKMQLGNDGVDDGSVSLTNPMPVLGPLTDAQMRAAAVPVSVAALPLPAGAATEATLAAINAKVPAVGQKAMAASAPVVIASDQSALPVSVAALPLPAGAATEASLAAMNAKVPTVGQKAMAASTPVVIASDQGALPMSAAALPLPAGAATEATLADLNAKVPTVGQKPMAASLPVVIASDQAALPVSGPMTDAQFRASAAPTSGLTDAQLRAAAVPVALASVPLPTGAATDAAVVALSAKFLPQTSIPDNLTPAIPVRPIGQDTWSVSFTDVGASFITPEFRAPDVGSGVGYSQVNGALLITTGVATNAEFLTRSVAKWRSTLQMRYSLVASQRIANQNFVVMLADLVGENLNFTINSATSITVAAPGHTFTVANIGQGMLVGGISGAAGVPGRYTIASVVAGISITFTVAAWPASGAGVLDLFGHTHVKQLYNGTTPTSLLVDSQRRGWASGDTAITINTSAAPGHIMQAEIAGREIYWADMLRASSVTPNVTLRGSRVENLPDDNMDLYLFLWSYNGATAPASTTTWTLGFVSIERFANTPVYIQGQEMQGAKNAAPVAVVGTVPVSGTVNATVTGGTMNPVVPATPYFVNSLASTNLALILTGTSGLQAFYATNTGAAVAFVKLYNKATAPVLASDIPEMIIPVPAAVSGVPGVAQFNIGFGGFRFALGLGIAITGLVADTDATVVAAGQVKIKLSRTI